MTVANKARGYLPTIDPPNEVLTITFRLHGSLPESIVEQFRADVIRFPPKKRHLAFHTRVENYLNHGHLVRHLADPEIATIVQDALLHFHAERYNLFAWAIMSNHVHLLLSLLGEWRLREVIGSIKKHSARLANEQLGRSGRFWARGHYDRIIRNEDHYKKAVWYIHANPVKAGLCETAEEYPWSSAHNGWSFKSSAKGEWSG